MQGIEQLGYEVVEQPMVPDGGLQTLRGAADMLADFGRYGDTYIVHAAEGETMVPMEVLDANPRLKKMLFTQMEEMGVEPERYIVGNELNSINPVTGRPEFFLKKLFSGVKKVVNKIGDVVKKIAPIVLPIVAPFLLPAMPLAFATGLGSLAGGLISGQSLEDSLKGAVISGGLAGLGNVAFRGGSFFGTSAAPTAGLGQFSLGEAFTPVNPFSQAGQAQIQAIRQAGQAQQAQQAGQQVTGAELDKIVADSSKMNFMPDAKDLSVGKDASYFQKTKNLFSDYLSPNRASIQPDLSKVTAEGAKAGADAIKATNQALLAQGQAALSPDAAQSIVQSSIKQATAAAQPGVFAKYGPITAATLGGAAASDELLGTSFITPPDIESAKYDPSKDPMTYAQNLIDANPEKYLTDPEQFFANNPMYANRFLQAEPMQENTFQTSMANMQGGIMGVANGGAIVGPGTPTSDSIPAMLSDGEFVMNAKAVRGAGNGDRQAGAKQMYNMMKQFERRV